MRDMYEYERYVCSKETLRETIEKYGVGVIPRVLGEEECESMVSKMWDFFEHITSEWEKPLDRKKEETWREFYKLYPLHSMLVQHWGVGHAEASWEVRQNRKIVEIFANLWNCDVNELLVSFDGLSFNLPPEVTKKGWNRGNTWYHTDQSFTKSEFSCVQSFVTGLDIDEYDATLSFMEGSNKYHDEFREAFNVTDKTNWYKLTREQETFYENRGCVKKNIKCPKGSLVFWDSRTIHCGIEADKRRSEPKLRAVIYLCYMPRSVSDKKNLEKKQKAFNEGSHNESLPLPHKVVWKDTAHLWFTNASNKKNRKTSVNRFGKKISRVLEKICRKDM
jgi:Phytanoyl-CoA dioxygenase (PhyH)